MSTQKSPWTRTIAGQPRVGATAVRARRTSMRDVEMFTEMTGDRNPVHYDAELAAKSPFGGLIVQGGVTTGLLNAVVAEDLPGPGTVFLETSWKFLKAVPIGETITATVKVEHVRDDKPICRIETVSVTPKAKIASSARRQPTRCRSCPRPASRRLKTMPRGTGGGGERPFRARQSRARARCRTTFTNGFGYRTPNGWPIYSAYGCLCLLTLLL